MIRRNYNINNTIHRAAKIAVSAAVFVLIGLASSSTAATKKAVTLTFFDSTMINDTLIRLSDIARVESQDADLARRLRILSVGDAAPAGFNRFINTADLVMFNIQPQFRDVQFNANHKRVKVLSDHMDRTVGEFEELIRTYVAERLAWEIGEWTLNINNLQNSWKSGRGAVTAEVSGLENSSFAKGNINLTLTVYQGTRVHRIPVQCRVIVTAPVFVASRSIQRGEELTDENSKLQVTDITNFAFVPLRRLPASGTMTASRILSAGNILHDRALRAIPLVARGDQVRIHFVGERVRISVIGVARDSGSQGDRIWVENLQTGKLVRAAVSGRGSVTVHQEGDRS